MEPTEVNVENSAGGNALRRVAIIGDASLAGQCVALSVDGGLDVVVVATEHAQVRASAVDRGIPVIDSREALAGALAEFEFDTLLSIANLRVVPASVLDRVRCAINMHDGPLPSYAGLNVTTWALLDGVAEHAVTWHLMTDEVDGGRVVTEERFAVDADETAFSLNARCYEAALASFPRVVAGLVAGQVDTIAQPAGERRTFRRFQRPVVVVDPFAAAETTAHAIRAVSLGHAAANTIGAAHLVSGDRHVVVTGARAVGATDDVAGGAAGRPIGTLRTAADGSALRLSTAGGDLDLSGFERPDGHPLTPAEALAALGTDMLAGPDAGWRDGFAVADATMARHEPAWRAVLAGAAPAVPAMLRTDGSARASARRAFPAGAAADGLVAAVAVWAARTSAISDMAISDMATSDMATSDMATTIGVTDVAARRALAALAPLAHEPVVRLDATDVTFGEASAVLADSTASALARGPFLRDLIGREPALVGTETLPRVSVDLVGGETAVEPSDGTLRVRCDDDSFEVVAAMPSRELEWIADQILAVVTSAVADPACSIGALALVGAAEIDVLDAGNRTELDYDRDATVDGQIATQVARTPDAPAVTAGGVTITYAELDVRAAAMADRLRSAGVRPQSRVGIAVERGIEMLVGVIATLRCGAAYVPLDPAFPADRVRFMIADSGLDVVVVEPWNDIVDSFPDGTVTIAPVGVPGRARDIDAGHVDAATPSSHGPDDLAYLIYTSGSTGIPKGVMLEHRNVVNFFAAMDEVIEHEHPGVWLAVTSLSFDISVLELLWTLTHGFHVVVAPDAAAAKRRRAASAVAPGVASAAAHAPSRPVSLSLFYFAAGQDSAGDGYRLLLDSARWADRNGFEAVWTPERHFHAFGGAYPNPAVVGAAVAAVTERVRIRAGSVVAPLHAPARIAEEWAVVDNLSHGRVDVSFAAGWQPNDFVLNPHAYADAKARLPEMIDTVRRLWRGDTVDLPGHDGAPVPIVTLPRPVQRELPVWLTSAGSPDSFERAGTLGLNVLTHLLGQSVEQLTANVERYRRAWRAAGHAGHGQVTLMLHTYLDADRDQARRLARGPLKAYLASAAGLIRNMASAFPTFAGRGADADEAFASLTADELDQLLDMAADRYLDTSGLFGGVDDAVAMIDRCSAAGVDEVACLIDFGVGTDEVLASLPLLGAVREHVTGRVTGGTDDRSVDETAQPAAAGAAEMTVAHATFAELVAAHSPTHLQCTPSLVTMLVADPADCAALGTIGHVMLGGEALPVALASELLDLLPGRLTNMYGPTETTIWSLVHEVTSAPAAGIPIGKPIGNTTVFVVDPAGRRLPAGAFGELLIGGDGVARGYHDRAELTATRFAERDGMGRVYATGDVVRIGADGVVEFGGRTDHQVKIRGHRIELGEIESVLDGHPDVVQSVVVASRNASGSGEPVLVAFVVARTGAAGDATVGESDLRDLVGARLPDAYVPARVIALDALPLTANGKIDRTRLAADAPGHVASVSAEVAAPSFDDVGEQVVAEVWVHELGRSVGRDDNFFEIGGNSLLAVAVFRRLRDRTGAAMALTDIFRYPTIRALAQHLDALAAVGAGAAAAPAPGVSAAPVTGADRGEMRRRALARRG
jgi:natural product biosynthesis luciferase-like monooxygenase protein